jgi:N-acetylglutamate synthase-like GNAT family acetyltransferase
LSSNQFYAAKTLIELCRLADNTKGVSYLENGMNAIEDFPAFFLMYKGNTLVSFLSVFIPNDQECEIYANTLPRFRKEGCFRQLYEMAAVQIKNYGIKKIYFVMEPGCISGGHALTKLGARLEVSEYLMSYNTRIEPKPLGILELKSTKTENGELIETYREDTKVGEISLDIEKNVATIYGVEVLPEYRGRRFGVETLLLTIKHLLDEGCCKIILNVSSSNKIAYRMYSHHGFVHVEQIDYWLKTV